MQRHSEEWINGGTLERLALAAGYKSSNISRRARELAEKTYDTSGREIPPVLDRRENIKGHVEYKWRKVEKIISSYEVRDGVARKIQQTLLI